MTRRRSNATLLAAALLALALPFQAAAGLFRAYLSEAGNDANDCSLLTPCRLLPAALAAVNAGGEIWMLDSANFNAGNVLINKSVSILAIPGAVGSMVANGGDAMTVNGAGVKVVLRNLRVVNLSGSNNGVSFLQGASLTVIECEFFGMPFVGLNIVAPGMRGRVMRSTFINNGAGIQVNGGIVNVLNNDFIGNTTAIKGIGSGGANNFPPNGSTRVRIGGGTLQDNTTAFAMQDPGLRASGTCNGSNIFVNNAGLNALGNGTWVTVTGNMDFNSGCAGLPFTIDNWNSPTN